MNIMNNAVATGRLTRDPEIRCNRDGSRHVRFTLAVQNNYTDRNGVRQSQFLPFDALVSANRQGDGVFELIGKGDLITVSYEVQNNNYTNRDGQKVYGLTLFVRDVALMESKAVTDARRQEQAAEEAAAQAGAVAGVPAGAVNDGRFMDIPDGIDEELPFN